MSSGARSVEDGARLRLGVALTSGFTRAHLDEFCAALTGDVVAAVVGPVTAGPLREVGVTPVQPERFRMGALIRLVSDHLQHNCVVRLRAGEVQLELRGRCLELQGRSLLLGPNALALFKALVRS